MGCKCKISYIENDMEFGIPLLIVLGMLFSIWSNAFFVCLFNGVMLIPIISTFLMLLGTPAMALYYGIKNNNPKLVRVWYIVKRIECVIIGIMIILNNSILGIFLLPIGVYLILCVKKILKSMVLKKSVFQEIIIEPPTIPKV